MKFHHLRFLWYCQYAVTVTVGKCDKERAAAYPWLLNCMNEEDAARGTEQGLFCTAGRSKEMVCDC